MNIHENIQSDESYIVQPKLISKKYLIYVYLYWAELQIDYIYGHCDIHFLLLF